MQNRAAAGDPFSAWLKALDERHLSALTPSEAGRALRALSSCYVERRARLAEGAALETAGKRAAFALFYAPLHFQTVSAILRALPERPALRDIIDLGCGTGAAGAAWALHQVPATVSGFDRSAWAVAEANWTYGRLGVRGRASRMDVARVRFAPSSRLGIVAAYTVNELPENTRARLLTHLLEAARAATTVLIVEPIARRVSPWWAGWEAACTAEGWRTDEWRFPASLGERQRQLARSAGLNPRELTARTLYAG